MKKHLITLPFFIFLYGCTSKEPTPNRPPGDFAVKTTVASDGKTITLNWTKAIDPDGDEVAYNVVLGSDTLAKGLKDTLYVIKGLAYDYSGIGTVLAIDPKNLSSKSAYTISSSDNPMVAIPDANFEKYLVEKGIDKDGAVNGQMAKINAKGITEIFINTINVKSLVGIEVFNDLINLSAYGPKRTGLLTKIDVSKNVKLKSLGVYFNALTELDVSKNIELEDLNCDYNQLTKLDLSKNIKLKQLVCKFNQIIQLDLSKNVVLIGLSCEENSLIQLDLSNNINLYFMSCWSNKLNQLDVSKNINLLDLYCYSNNLTQLDLSRNINLRSFNCTNNNISTICVADVNKANSNSFWQKDSTATYKICN